MKKQVFYSEIAYLVGIVLLALCTALTAWGNFGLSMVVAPAYVLHRKMSESLAWFSFGAGEYVLQAAVLLLMMLLLRRVKLSYFLSFLTAVFYGLVLDLGTKLTGLFTCDALWLRLIVYILGCIGCCASIALLFHTYLPLEAYEMFVKEIGAKLKWNVRTAKTTYDCLSLLLAVVMSLCLFGSLQGIGIGTVVCALLYGTVIELFSNIYEKCFVFRDKFPWRKYFEEDAT